MEDGQKCDDEGAQINGDEHMDTLGQLIAEYSLQHPSSIEHVSCQLVRRLPEHCPHDDDGFARSFDDDESDGIRSFFDKYGYVVVRDVLSAREVQASREEFFGKFDKEDDDDITNFFNSRENWFSRMGIIGIANDLQSPSQLSNRQNEKVYSAFAAVYGETELFVDHDRLGAMRPTLQTDGTVKKEWQTVNNWVHLDCNPISGEISIGSMAPPPDGRYHDFDTEAPFLVQGLLSLSDARKEDGGFQCVPGSHHIAREWTELNGLESKRPQLRPKQVDPIKEHVQNIPVRAGSLVIWSQFTMHANHPNRSDRWRLNQYVRMYPINKTRFGPIATDPCDYPVDFVENAITPLGRRLFGIDPWEGGNSAKTEGVRRKLCSCLR